ncbi:MAG: rhodanese-like domain-containing protein [Lachnospiraceae bacterium]|nr:rhodanese-like domain-containing protein [Lachnospiraceae bacterium]
MKLFVTMFGIMFFLSACQAPPRAKAQTPETTPIAEYRKLTPEEAFEMMSAQETTIVDVRTEAEYQEGHIENAILVPNESIGETPPEALPDKDATLLVYCRSGRRSKEASEKLLALGYQNVYDFGGITDWPYDVVKGS